MSQPIKSIRSRRPITKLHSFAFHSIPKVRPHAAKRLSHARRRCASRIFTDHEHQWRWRVRAYSASHAASYDRFHVQICCCSTIRPRTHFPTLPTTSMAAPSRKSCLVNIVTGESFPLAHGDNGEGATCSCEKNLDSSTTNPPLSNPTIILRQHTPPSPSPLCLLCALARPLLRPPQ